MTEQAGLERGYRRLLACYPKGYRREYLQEILAVLMASAGDGQRRPGLAESANLIKSALRMRLRPPSRPPRTVFTAVKLMCTSAALEAAAWITILVTAGEVRSATAHHDPALWHGVLVHLIAFEIFGPIAVVAWLWMAWANSRGREGARVLVMSLFALTTAGLLWWLGQGAAVYAPADLIAAAVLWLVQLAAMVLIFSKKSGPYYRHEPAKQ